ncbi:hypothetical protein AMS68_000160 [Peltaster fructicola]|uniref:Uncharacterized protein n=1 Tax=Peltaster fructicola TaxID=286661 RepID=A0A6H0XIU1_9PEZI|nr:hypothetical protein AMS68_000160 [Peltaster fructicola]
MAIQKKHAKARLDKYYYLAKEKGYRARAAFKLIQLNKKYGFLQKSKVLIDLCAAPGSWMQVAAETMPAKSLIIGVDLAPIKAIPKTISFQGDITTDKTRAIIRGHLKTWKADTVVHDGAPNVGTAWVQDAFTQNELVLCSLKLATDFLAPNGTFVTKVFRSKDSAKLEWIFKQLFAKVEQTKPPSSRNVSAETFYVCRGFKAPKHLDPKFLDPKYAFAEVEETSVNMEARVFNPEKKKRKREGYEEGDWTQFHEAPASEFVQTHDPITMLGTLNRLHFRQEGTDDIALAALDRLPETTEDVRLCCEDLKVLGRKEFKILLRWRLKARELFGLRQKKTSHTKATEDADTTAGEEVAVVEPMDEELALQEEIQRMKDMQDKSKRKDRRKDNERKQKEIVRMQMNMTTPHEIGIEAADTGEAVFRIKDVEKGGVAKQLSRGRMHIQLEPEKKETEEEEEEEEDDAGDRLEDELDQMYLEYREKREDRNAKAKAKRIRLQSRGGEDEEFDGFSGEEAASSDDGLAMEEDDSESDDDEDEGQLTVDLKPKVERKDGLTTRAASFFQQDIFKDIVGLDVDEHEHDSGIDVDSGSRSPSLEADLDELDAMREEVAEQDDDDEIEDVAAPVQPKHDDGWSSDDEAPVEENGRPNIDIITAEAMTLAHQLATGQKTKHDLKDDNFNKYSHRDVDGLPEWFLDDENQHSKLQRPITAEAAKAIKEKTRALNARPIKKVREAKARKTLRAARRLEKLKKKSEGLAEAEDGTEKDKARDIAKLMARAKKGGKKKQQVKVVVAGGSNKGSGRPRGVKGKYKMVDSRLKKDVRAEKRLKKKIKGKK